MKPTPEQDLTTFWLTIIAVLAEKVPMTDQHYQLIEAMRQELEAKPLALSSPPF